MTRTNFTRIAGATLVAGFASFAFATPASALEAPEPGGGGLVFDSDSGPAVSSDNSQWLEIGLGAVGGLAIAGAGVAAASGMKHRHPVPTS